MKRFAAVFGCAFAIYLVFFSGHYVSGDEAQRIAWAKALIDCHCNDISRYFPSEHYAKYGIGISLLHVPLILLTRWIKIASGIPTEGPLNMLLYTFNGAVGVALIYILLVRQGVQRHTATFGALAIGVTSVWFPYSKVEYAESIVTTLLLGMYLLADTYPWIAGLIGGFAVAVRTDAIVWIILTGVIAPSKRKSWLPISLATIPGLMLMGASNYARTGSALSSGYEIDFSTPILTGLYGLLFSAGKSVFLFSPLMLLYPAAARKLWSDSARRRFVVWSLVLFGTQLLVYSKWWDWSGDDAWGPRFLVTATMVCLAVVAASEYVHSRWFALLAVAGLIVQVPPVLIGPHTSLMAIHLRNLTKVDPNSHLHLPITLDDIRFNPQYSQITDTFEMLLFETSDGRVEASSSFIKSFDPPLRPKQIVIDILWAHPNLIRAPRVTQR